MYSELECGICYRTYNAGRRCPRELHCKHTFCESCLAALSRPRGAGEAHLEAGRLIACPLCRHATSVSGEGMIRAELRVDECALERLLAAGVLEQEEDPEEGDQLPDEAAEEEEEEEAGEEETLPETPAEESDSSEGFRGGKFRQSLRKVWKKISGKGARQGGRNCMTNDDLRNLAMMSCYMF
ncbi:E3 ubiquitin-protein ligase-like [Mugil cephalus]|uniref:E3 ubiquitin-protein ligase-like n=1 Tax=Mugil cephalus TaxID=48193 RepID=UPI001FB82C43|nr:E3 ubiquitin-protein ligase-like [Mugil cephalus]